MKNLLKKLSHLSSLISHLSSQGFTLIELLVVIAVLGVLATIVLLAVNPGEQLQRARDTSRVAGVTQLGRSLQAYFTAAGGNFSLLPDGSAGATATDWMQPLVTSNDLKVKPANPAFGTAPVATSNCDAKYQSSLPINNGNAGGYCYRTNATFADAVVYARLESNLYNNKCTTGANTLAYGVFSTADARFGVVCRPVGAGSTDPTVGTQSFIATP